MLFKAVLKCISRISNLEVVWKVIPAKPLLDLQCPWHYSMCVRHCNPEGWEGHGLVTPLHRWRSSMSGQPVAARGWEDRSLEPARKPQISMWRGVRNRDCLSILTKMSRTSQSSGQREEPQTGQRHCGISPALDPPWLHPPPSHPAVSANSSCPGSVSAVTLISHLRSWSRIPVPQVTVKSTIIGLQA